MRLTRLLLLPMLLPLCSCWPFSANQQDADRSGSVASSKAGRNDGFTLTITADARLNLFRNNAHALHLCVYQLKDANAFNRLAQQRQGMAKLLECAALDGSVAGAKRIVVQPGQLISETPDLAQGTRYLGIASGYYGTGKGKTVQTIPLPSGSSAPTLKTVHIDLGPSEIKNVTVE